MTPYATTNTRAIESIQEIAQTFSLLWAQNANNASYLYENRQYIAALGQFIYQLKSTAQGNDFTSFSELYGPHMAYGDNFTSLSQYNFSNPFNTFTFA